MVEVLKSTFEDHLPDIQKAIEKADFVAIDTEFTGLASSGDEKTTLFDTTEERYQKLRRSMTQFTMTQIGLSAFKKKKDQNSYEATTYNFYLYPSTFGPIDSCFLVQASSFAFLCKYKFDFNKFVYEGIPYLNKTQRIKVRKHLYRGSMFKGEDRSNYVDEEALQTLCSRVAEWLVQNENEKSATLQLSLTEVKEWKFIRNFVLQTELRNRFPNIDLNIIRETIKILRIGKVKVDGNRLDEKTTEEDNKTDEEKVMGGKGEENMMDAHDEEDRLADTDDQALETLCSRVEEWLQQNQNDETACLQVPISESEDLKVMRDVDLQQQLKKRFQNLDVKITWEVKRVLDLWKVTEGERKTEDEKAEEAKDEEERMLDSLTGFTKVINFLKSRHGTPIVGHNMLLDLLLMYDKFHEPLPATLQEFKTGMATFLPNIFDTKHICNTERKFFRDTGLLEKTSLNELFLALSSTPGQQHVCDTPSVSHTTDTYNNTRRPHEAAYDAYMCGFAYLRLCHMLTFRNVASTEVRPCSFSRYKLEMKNYKNRINVIRGGASHICLDQPDPPSTRPPWLFVQSKSSSYEIKRMQLVKWFSPYGAVDVRMTDTKSALVATGSLGCANDILRAFRKHRLIKVNSYNMWRHSPVVRRCLWAGAILSGGACLLALFSSRKRD